MTDRESFLKHIAEDTSDTSRMLVFSDWLEEHGELKEAMGWRFLVEHGKKPAKWSNPQDGWYWFRDAYSTPTTEKCHRIPLAVGKFHAYLTEILVYEWAAQNMDLDDKTLSVSD